tara:strand:- start:226 stop:522 length:297 start_codon:yes stop_codon:yes gene_type:complete
LKESQPELARGFGILYQASMIKKIRSLDKKPKRILFVGIVGSVWFFGMENWFRRTGGGINLDGTTYTYDVKDWEGVFLTTFVTAFFAIGYYMGLERRI